VGQKERLPLGNSWLGLAMAASGSELVGFGAWFEAEKREGLVGVDKESGGVDPGACNLTPLSHVQNSSGGQD
jgi:hypothetical protein